jgi:tetratricopeptide (TPR) repeat protein
LLIAAAGIGLHRTWTRPVVAATGGIIALAAAFFVVISVIADTGLLQHITSQQSELSAIYGQFGYSVPRTIPASIGFFGLPGQWRTIINELRPGWFASIAGGSMMLGSNFRALAASFRNARRRIRLGVWIISAAVLLLLMARPVASNLFANAALTATEAGDYQSALSDFRTMDALDHDMVLRSGVEVGWGTALEGIGNRESPLALLADSRLQQSRGNGSGQLAELQQALHNSPNDPVLIEEYLVAGRKAALSGQDPGALQLLISTASGDTPTSEYTLARLLYERHAYSDAFDHFTRVLDTVNEPNVRSSAYTYKGLCEIRLGHPQAGRGYLLNAVSADVEYNNSLARSLTTGLYQALPD